MKTTTKTGIIVGIALVALLISPLVFAAPANLQSVRSSGQQIALSQSHLEKILEIGTIAMDTTIGYVKNIGGDTSGLITSEEKFRSSMEGAISGTSLNGIKTSSRAALENTKEFSETARNEIVLHDGDPGELVDLIATALKSSEGLKNMSPDEWKELSDNILIRFDNLMVRGDTLLSRLSSKGFDTGEASSTLNEIKGYRTELGSAVASGNINEIRAVAKVIAPLGKEFKSELPSPEKVIPFLKLSR